MSGEKNNYKNVEQTSHPFFHIFFDKKDSGIEGKERGGGGEWGGIVLHGRWEEMFKGHTSVY